MPKKVEQRLKAEVKKKPWSSQRKAAYVYGTMRKTGWKPKKKGK